ncbi:FAD-dependent oxidoreductase [Candidatus Margulisiibacteriota bacterium]
MKLFEPIKIGQLKIKNRIVMPAINLAWLKDGFIDEKTINYFSARASGGVGLITVGGALIFKNTAVFQNMFTVYNDECISGFKQLNQALHDRGTLSSLQLLHPGRLAPPFINNKKTPVSASAIPSPVMPSVTPNALSVEDIKDVLVKYGRAAWRGKEGGFDAIEVQAASSFLIEQFLSPASNKRDDKYGGSLQNRLRFAFEVIEAIKNKIGNDFPLIFRIAADEIMPDGYNLDEGIVIAQELKKKGVHALSLLGGGQESIIGPLLMDVPDATFSYMAAEVKKAVKIPIITGVRLRNIKQAEEIIVSNKADMVFFGRPLLADPNLVNKIQESQAESIVSCISCNSCFDEIVSLKPLICTMNPMLGREEIEIEKTAKAKKVVVVGAGPAGIKAAITASQCGHAVTLYEKQKAIGGHLKLCSVPTGKKELQKALLSLKDQLKRSKVKVITGIKINNQKLLDLKPDSVIIATGSEPIIPSIPGIDLQHVITIDDFLLGTVIPGRNVVIIGGDAKGCEIALTIARKGAMSPESAVFLLQNDIITDEQAQKYTLRSNRRVVIIEKTRKIGRGFSNSNRWMVLKEIGMCGIDVLTNSEVKEIKNSQVLVVSGKEKKETAIFADTVIIAAGYQSNKSGFEDLEGKIKEVYFIGDAVKPRKLKDAIKEGFDVGIKI